MPREIHKKIRTTSPPVVLFDPIPPRPGFGLEQNNDNDRLGSNRSGFFYYIIIINTTNICSFLKFFSIIMNFDNLSGLS